MISFKHALTGYKGEFEEPEAGSLNYKFTKPSIFSGDVDELLRTTDVLTIIDVSKSLIDDNGEFKGKAFQLDYFKKIRAEACRSEQYQLFVDVTHHVVSMYQQSGRDTDALIYRIYSSLFRSSQRSQLNHEIIILKSLFSLGIHSPTASAELYAKLTYYGNRIVLQQLCQLDSNIDKTKVEEEVNNLCTDKGTHYIDFLIRNGLTAKGLNDRYLATIFGSLPTALFRMRETHKAAFDTLFEHWRKNRHADQDNPFDYLDICPEWQKPLVLEKYVSLSC